MSPYLKALQKRYNNLNNRFKEAFNILFAPRKGKLNQYVSTVPSDQNALDLFQEEWISRLPDSFQSLKAGQAALFEDSRLDWAIQYLGGVKGKNILELGPLEGGHSYMLQKQGADSIISIEANPKAYLRCLVIKEILNLNRVRFLCGDFMEYLRLENKIFDLCISSGVLYHMASPIELIALAAKKSSHLFLWTHYYDPEICRKNLLLRPRFSTHSKNNYEGFSHTLYRYQYKSARSWNTFCGGPAPFSHWLNRQDILNSCRYFGLKEIQISHDQPDHPHGPSFALVASRS
jgi:hypothetical protein